ncbi:MAG: DUF2062 domain-containing protein, partial [Polyangiaceae bacterium]
REIGVAVATGVFVGCTPAIGLHGWVAVGLATLFKLSRVWSFLGSRISNIFVFPWIVLAEVQIAHRLRAGAWLHLTPDEIVAQRGRLLIDWAVGAVPVGLALGLIAGSLAYVVASIKARRRQNLAPIEEQTDNSLHDEPDRGTQEEAQ